MIIDYDKNPTLTTDQKLQSLMQSMQMAFDEVKDGITKSEKKQAAINADHEKRISALEE